MGNSLLSATLFFNHHSTAACFPYTAVLESLQFFTLFSFRGSLGFLANFPQLKRLTASKIDLEAGFHDKFLPRAHTNLKELYLQHDCMNSTATIERVAEFFPELTTLVIRRATNDVLRVVYSALPKLEEFAVFDGSFTDEGKDCVKNATCLVVIELIMRFIKGISGVKNSTLRMIAPSSSMRDLDAGALRQGLPISCLPSMSLY